MYEWKKEIVSRKEDARGLQAQSFQTVFELNQRTSNPLFPLHPGQDGTYQDKETKGSEPKCRWSTPCNDGEPEENRENNEKEASVQTDKESRAKETRGEARKENCAEEDRSETGEDNYAKENRGEGGDEKGGKEIVEENCSKTADEGHGTKSGEESTNKSNLPKKAKESKGCRKQTQKHTVPATGSQHFKERNVDVTHAGHHIVRRLGEPEPGPYLRKAEHVETA